MCPPHSVFCRYDVHLRNVVSDLLQLNPTRRPSLKKLLQSQIMKDALKVFLQDIFKKKSSSLGVGTMVRGCPRHCLDHELSGAGHCVECWVTSVFTGHSPRCSCCWARGGPPAVNVSGKRARSSGADAAATRLEPRRPYPQGKSRHGHGAHGTTLHSPIVCSFL